VEHQYRRLIEGVVGPMTVEHSRTAQAARAARDQIANGSSVG
jgi:hypothetical protein